VEIRFLELIKKKIGSASTSSTISTGALAPRSKASPFRENRPKTAVFSNSPLLASFSE